MKIHFTLFLFVLSYSSWGQGYKTGSKVEVEWSSGTWYPATIVDISDTQFKVHLDGDGANTSRDQWIFKNKGIIRPAKAAGTSAPPAVAKNAATTPAATPITTSKNQPAANGWK